MLAIVWCLTIFIIVAIARSEYLIRTNEMPDIEDVMPRDPRSGGF